MANTKDYIKKCPRCGTDIEPKRFATKGDKALAGVMGVVGGIVGFAFGGPWGAAAGAVASYYANKAAILSIEDDHDENQWYKYSCPKCGTNWTEKLHTNDDPSAPSWLNSGY